MPSKKTGPKVKKFRSRGEIDPKAIGMLLNKAGEDAVEEIWDQHQSDQVPKFDDDLNATFERARVIRQENLWLKTYFDVKADMMNYGLQIRPRVPAGKKLSDEALDKFNVKIEKFLEQPAAVLQTGATDANNTTIGVPGKIFTTQRERVHRFIREAWDEYLLLKCAIAYWSDAIPYPTLLPLEKCRYKDVMGIETLFYKHGLGVQDRKLLPPDQAKRFEKAEVLLSEQTGDFYKVLKDERTGFGIGRSSVQSIFRVVAQIEDMEFGEHSYAFGGKMKFRHHKVGHEIKNGPMAGKATHFWTKKRGDSIRSIFENKIGFLGDYIGNFDHIIEIFHEAIEYYKAEKWSSVERRLAMWGGPMAAILMSPEEQPFVSQLLRAEAEALRNKFAQWIEPILVDAFSMPVDPIELTWSNDCFFDTKQFCENAKTGLMTGPLSQQTWRDKVGFNNPTETRRKIAEGDDAEKNWRHYAPAYDSAHGPDDQQVPPPAGAKGSGSAPGASSGSRATTSTKKNGRPAK
jgi:hypothetical protein